MLPLLVEDITDEEIAAMLTLSPHTIHTHRKRIMKKLDLHSKTELLRYVMQRGLANRDK